MLAKYKYLSLINSPYDLRKLPVKVLPELCEEIRSFMVDTITKVGGHLGAGLGVVELTVALHYVFNTPVDKIVFDVGHQGYPHKIITGRKELLHTIRQKGGISGFLKPNESQYDAFGAGHASTSISAALGIAMARDIKGENYKSIAVIGDGAMTGGLAYEALNNAGVQNRDLLVILNDNNISIDENVSAISHYFNTIYSSHKIQTLKNNIYDAIGKVGERGDRMRKLVSKIVGGVRSVITPGMLFEAFGFSYFGPIAGNNVHKIIKFLFNIKNIQGPTFLHVVTEKGKGYELAEKDFRKFHAVSSINKHTGVPLIKENSLNKYQDTFGEIVKYIINKDKNIIAISAAMIDGTGLDNVLKEYPEQIVDVGIAEEHAVTFAAGLAIQGITPIVAIYSSFMQRAFDNIIHDCALQNLHIVFALDRAGLVGEDGSTHHGVFDMAYLRMIPNMTIMAPKDNQELYNMVYSAVYNYKNCVAIRYPRGTGIGVASIDKLQEIPIGKSEILFKGKDVCILAIGRMVNTSIEVRNILSENNIDVEVINARFVKPLDTELLDDINRRHNIIITIEDGQKIGGFGNSIVEYFNEKQYNKSIYVMGFEDKFIEHGTVTELLKDNGLDAQSIALKIQLLLTK